MTREELKKEKLRKEKEFLKSIEGKYLNQQEKSKFRETSVWKEFRKKFIGKEDPVTLKKLTKKFNLHHLSLSPKEYQNLKMNRFVPLGSQCHDVVHWLYGYYRKDRNIIKRLKSLLDRMIQINDGKDICDYRKEVKFEKSNNVGKNNQTS